MPESSLQRLRTGSASLGGARVGHFASVAAACTKATSLALLLTLAGARLEGQTNTTALTGTVSDQEGLRLPSSSVTLVNTATGTKVVLDTKAQGEFSFSQILPGHYVVTVHHEGFADQTQSVDLFIATPLALRISLSAGATASVEVQAGGPSSLNQVDASLGKPFDNAQVETLPYLANNTLSLLALQPGVLSFDSSNTIDPRAGTINGARQDQTNVTLDGLDDNESNFNNAFTGVLRSTRDSIEEFRVTTSGVNADAGRSSGAQVSLQTKSGTNVVHGTAYYYYRDPAAASNNWFYKQSELASGKPNIAAKILQDTYGATLGLPIVKDKIFFFGAYEGYKQASDSVVTQEVPLGSGDAADNGVTPGLRNGTITYLNTAGTFTTLTSAQIAALDTGCTAGGGCPNGPGVNAAMLAYLRAYPLANGKSLGDGVNTGSYTFVSPSPISNITNIVRLDYNLSPKQLLFVRGNLQSDNAAGTSQFPGGLPTSNTFGNNRGIAGGHIWSINDHLTNNARYGLTRYGNAIGGGINSNYVGFATGNGALSPQAPLSFSTYVIEDTHNFADDLSWVKGRHTIQFGFNSRLIYNSQLTNQDEFANAQITATTLALGGIANTGSNLDASAFGYPKIATSFNTAYDFAASEVTGLTPSANEYLNYKVAGNSLTPLPIGVLPTHYFKTFEQEYYVQDQFRITPGLTITAGVRYVYLGVPYETNGQQVAANIGSTEYAQARAASAAQGVAYNPQISYVASGPVNNAPGYWTAQKLNFAPRFAFNYSPDQKTSIRGGFMLAFDHFGQAIVDLQNQSGSFGLSSLYSSVHNQTVNTSPRFTGATAVPTQLITGVPTGVQNFPVALTGSSGSIVYAIDDQLRTPYAETFDFSVQREVSRGFTLTAAYVGRLGRHVISYEDTGQPVNLYDPSSGQTWFQAATILDKAKDAGTSVAAIGNIPYIQNIFPNATYTTGGVTYHGTQAVYGQLTRGNDAIELYNLDLNAANSPSGQTHRFYPSQFISQITEASNGTSNYNALQLSLRHTVTRNFIYDFNYTYSKSLDLSSEPERGSGTTASTELGSTGAPAVVTNVFNPAASYADSDFDIRHLISADWTLAIPYGHGQRFGGQASTLMDELLGGWNLSGIAKWSTGLPWSALSAGGVVTGYEFRAYDVQIAPIQNSGHHTYIPAASGALTANAFQNGTAAYTSFRLPYAGETGQRNNLRADGYFSVDPGISKSFRTYREQSFRLTVEAFNVTNATRFAIPPTGNNGRSGASTFGTYASLLNSPRQMQFSGRYTF